MASTPDEKNTPPNDDLASAGDLGASISDVWSVMDVTGNADGWGDPTLIPPPGATFAPTPPEDADAPAADLASEPPPAAEAPPAQAPDDAPAPEAPAPAPEPAATSGSDFDAFDLAPRGPDDTAAPSLELAALVASAATPAEAPATAPGEDEAPDLAGLAGLAGLAAEEPEAPSLFASSPEEDDIPPLDSLLPPEPAAALDELPAAAAAPTPFVMPDIKLGKTQDVLTLSMGPAPVVKPPGPNWGIIGIIGGAIALVAIIIGVAVYVIQSDTPQTSPASATLAANTNNAAPASAPATSAPEEEPRKDDSAGWVGEAPDPADPKADAPEEKGAQPVQTVAQNRKKQQPDATRRAKGDGNAAPPPVRGGGNLVLSCPGKSDVTVDGRAVGTTPTRVSVAPGPHKVTMTRKADGRKWAAKVQAEKGKDTPVQCRFR